MPADAALIRKAVVAARGEARGVSEMLTGLLDGASDFERANAAVTFTAVAKIENALVSIERTLSNLGY